MIKPTPTLIKMDYEHRMAVARLYTLQSMANDYAALNPSFSNWCIKHAKGVEVKINMLENNFDLQERVANACAMLGRQGQKGSK